MTANRGLTVAGVALSLVGCDSVWGLSGEPSPCDLDVLDDVTPTVVTTAADFSIAKDREVVLVVVDGFVYERQLGDLDGDVDVASLPLGVFPVSRIGIATEGEVLFYVAGTPPAIKIATFDVERGWQRDTRAAPPGIDVGTPSSAAFGARRVVVREAPAAPALQEYVEDGDGWMPVGDPLAMAGVPNLSTSALTLVFAGVDGEGASTVFAANRPSLSDPFEPPRAILRAPGAELRAPHVVGAHCDALFVSVDGELRRYAR